MGAEEGTVGEEGGVRGDKYISEEDAKKFLQKNNYYMKSLLYHVRP